MQRISRHPVESDRAADRPERPGELERGWTYPSALDNLLGTAPR